MRKSLRTIVLTGAVLFACAAPSFASLGGSAPRPPATTSSTAVIIAQTVLTVLGA